jgi:hypothetical protein
VLSEIEVAYTLSMLKMKLDRKESVELEDANELYGMGLLTLKEVMK